MKKMKFLAKRTINRLAIAAVMIFMLSCLGGCGENAGNPDTTGTDGSSQGKAEESSADRAASEENAVEDTQYCDREDCHKMFSHIHITMDNWQDYFEFTTAYQFGNGTENMDKYIVVKTVFNVRDEWKNVISGMELRYHVDYKKYSVPGEIDWDNRTVTIEENAEKTYSAQIDDQWYTADRYNFDSSTGLEERRRL